MEEKNMLSFRFRIAFILAGVIEAGLLVIAFCVAWGTAWFLVIVALFVLILLFVSGCFLYIWKPYQETTRKLGYFAAKGSREELEQLRYYYNLQEKQAICKTLEYMTTSTTLELSKRQAQYQALNVRHNTKPCKIRLIHISFIIPWRVSEARH